VSKKFYYVQSRQLCAGARRVCDECRDELPADDRFFRRKMKHGRNHGFSPTCLRCEAMERVRRRVVLR
jgi:RNase P subunit RPR2